MLCSKLCLVVVSLLYVNFSQSPVFTQSRTDETPPVSAEDGWITATPASVGLSSILLQNMDSLIKVNYSCRSTTIIFAGGVLT